MELTKKYRRLKRCQVLIHRSSSFDNLSFQIHLSSINLFPATIQLKSATQLSVHTGNCSFWDKQSEKIAKYYQLPEKFS